MSTGLKFLPPCVRSMVKDAIACRKAAWAYRSKWHALSTALAEALNNRHQQRTYDAILNRARGLESARNGAEHKHARSCRSEYVDLVLSGGEEYGWDTVSGVTSLYYKLTREDKE